MSRKIMLLNSSHYIGGNTYRYQFTNAQNYKEGDKLSFQSFSMYNQSPNISPDYGNDSFAIKWIDNVTYQFSIPEGFYTSSDFNTFMQFCCLQNGLYLEGSNGKPQYFLSILANIIQYKAQVNIIAVPTQSQAQSLGYTKPENAEWNFLSTARTPQLILPEALGRLFGYKAELTLPPQPLNDNYSKVSDITPTLNLVKMYSVTCNLLSSNFSVYPELFFQCPLAGTSYGGVVQLNSTSPALLDIQPSKYSFIDIKIFDDKFRPLKIIDNDFSLVLYIDQK
jgi:hypothetical protein